MSHAKYSASSSHRWMNCPGSIALSEKAPKPPSSRYADEGTEAHKCLELMLRNKFIAPTRVEKFSKEMMTHAKFACDVIDKIYKSYDSPTILTERKVDSSPFLNIAGQFGTLDCSIFEEFGKLTMIDFKYGAGIEVEPKDNPQLIYYALAMLYQYNFNFSSVDIMVIQPRIDGEAVKNWSVSVDELSKWADKFKTAVIECEKKDAIKNLHSGDWCRFCPAAVICPNLRDGSMKKAQIAFNPSLKKSEVSLPPVERIKNLSETLNAIEKIEVWAEQVKAHAFHVLEKGGRIQGFKIVPKRATRKWVDADKISVVAKKQFGDLAFSEPELLSPAQLEKSLKTKFKLKSVKNWIENRTTNVSTGVTMVREDDKRQGVNHLAEVFK